MKTNLLLLKSSLLKTSGVLNAAFLLLVLLLIGTATRAQVVYSMGEPGNTTAATSGDLIKKMNYDGTNGSTVITGASAGLIQPLNVALDGNNNRIFVSEGNLSGNVIKVITGSSVTGTITSANSAYIKDIGYDVVGNWLYYITEGGDITQVTANDALYRVHPHGSGSQTVAASVTKNPYRLEVDAANNKVYVVDVSYSGRSIKTVDLANSNAVTSRGFATSLTTSVYDVALDKVNGYLYYCAEGGSAATLSATDQVRRQNIDGSGDVQIAASVCNSPFRLGLDAGNNRLYVGDAYYGSGKIVAINLTNNTFSTTLNFATGQNFPQIYDFGVPEQPTVTTAAASSVAATSATLGGTLVYGYGLSTERGIVYSSTNSTPTVTDTKAANATVTANGAYSASVTGLTPATTYYARAYAVNGAGTTYGSVVSFLTQSNDANLSAFTISSGTLSPAFAVGTTSYAATVANATTSITVTPTRSQANATIKVNTVAVTSGSASGSISLGIGNTVISTVVTAQDASTKTYTLTVTRPKAAQTITFNAIAAKTFGGTDFATGASTNSGLTISYVSSNTAVATIVSGQIHIVGAGTSTITASQAGDANYLAASDATQTLTVEKAAQSITFGAIAAKTYGNADFAPGATVASGLNVTYASDNTAVATIVNNQVHIVGQGTANVTASQGGNANYNAAANMVQSLTVNKANVTVTATAKTKNYGDTDPAFTYTTTGVANGDTPTGELTRVSPSTNKFIGTYAIDQGTLNYGNNYNTTYVGANLTINKRPITVLPIGKTKVYGNDDPFLNQFQVVGGSIAPGDATGDQFGRAAGESVGTYLMTLGPKKFYGNINGTFGDITNNYDVTVQPAYVTITARPITVTANAQSKTYGDADPALTYTADALAFSDSFTGVLSRAAGEGFGTYAINKNTLALNSNYALTYIGGNLTIAKKVVNVTADAKAKTYGDADPAFTYTADALANGESFTGALTRATGENFGAYAINQGTLGLSGNYTLNYTAANLTINKKTINVTASAKSKTYGDSDPALTYTADALSGGDSFTGAITRAPGETFGTYAITQGTLAATSNYDVSYTGANLTINKRDITVNPVEVNVQYGNSEQSIGYSYSGTFADGDSFTGQLGRVPGTSAGSYAINQGTLTVGNAASYNLTVRNANYNILQREIVVSGGSTIKIYGDPDPAINYSIVSGTLLDGAQITGALTRDAGEISGPYAVRQGTLAISDSNHKLTFQGGYFEVDRAPLNFTIDNKTKVATKPNPALTYSVTGYKNGDTEATAFNSSINLITDANINSVAGDYNIYPVGGVFASNYNITTTGGTLTVTPGSSVNTLSSLTVSNGTIDPIFDPTTEFYTVTIPNASTTTTLTPTVTDPLASISIGYDPATATALASGTPYTVTITPGNTEQVPMNITAEDGSVKSYYFNVAAVPSDSKLSNLESSVGIIAPSFNPNVTSYTLDVSADTDSITITPTTHDRLATARVSGGGEGGGNGAKKIALHEGGNPVSIIARSADRTTTTFYQLYIKRPIRLKTLTLSAGKLLPAFDPNITSYVAKVGPGIPSITVTPTGNESYFQITVNGEYVNYGDASSPVTVNEDGSTTIAVTIFGSDGETSKTYNINVQRSSVNADLAGISVTNGTLDPTFDSGTDTYHVYLPNATTAVAFTPTLADPNATMRINYAPTASGTTIEESNFAVGMRNYYIVTLAEDGSTSKTYTLSIIRAPSGEATMANLTLSNGTLSPAYNPTMGNHYNTTVANGISQLTITPTLADTTATLLVKVDGNTVTSAAGAYQFPVSVGDNEVSIKSTAQDGTTVATYTLTITRQKSSVATLDQLLLSSGTLSPVFSSDVTNYNSTVNNATGAITVTPIVTDATSSVKINGVNTASGTPSQSIHLNVGMNAVPIEVTAAGGNSNFYNITIMRTGSAVADLTAIRLNPSAVLVNTTGTSDYNYSMSVSSSVNTVALTPTAKDSNATIRVNGVIVASGTPSNMIALTGASTVISIQVTAENGTTVKTSSVTVLKAGSSVADLSAIRLNPSAILVTSTGSADYNYTMSVTNNTNSVMVVPTAKDANSTIRVNGVIVASGTPSGAILLTGSSTLINIRVTAEDGTTVKNTGLTIMRTGSAVADLTAIRLNPSAVLVNTTGTSDYNYSMSVSSSVNTVALTPTAKDSNATIRVNGVIVASGTPSNMIALTGASTVISIQVTAENGTTVKTSSVTVLKAGSSVADLSAIRLNPSAILVTSTGSADYNYTMSVTNNTNSVMVVPTAKDANSTIRVNGVIVASGTPSGAILLTGSSTLINIRVTAEDGTTVKNTGLTIMRTGSAVADLTAIRLNPSAVLVNTTGTSDYNYSMSVSSSVNTVALTPTAKDSNATIRVNGVIVASGTPSNMIALTGASTVISIQVTAENGTTVKTSSVTVLKAGSSVADLSAIRLNPSAILVTSTGSADYNYTMSVTNNTNSVMVVPTAKDANATIRVNGVIVASGTPSGAILLTGSSTLINIRVTAEDGTTVKNTGLTITREAPLAIASVNKNNIDKLQQPENSPEDVLPEINIHQAVSPNGDGINDRFTIDGIAAYPENTVSIMNRNGDVIYSAKGYDNYSNAFDGHAGNGTLQQAGTYFYSVEYKKGEETKRRTGYIVIKY